MLTKPEPQGNPRHIRAQQEFEGALAPVGANSQLDVLKCSRKLNAGYHMQSEPADLLCFRVQLELCKPAIYAWQEPAQLLQPGCCLGFAYP